MDVSCTIGQAARAAEVNVETIRYYQRRGLLDVPERPRSGPRRYSADTVARILFIKRAQQLGFSLTEVQRLLELEQGGSCRATRDLARVKLGTIEARIADLERMHGALEQLIRRCEAGRRPRNCPIIETLSGHRRDDT